MNDPPAAALTSETSAKSAVMSRLAVVGGGGGGGNTLRGSRLEDPSAPPTPSVVIPASSRSLASVSPSSREEHAHARRDAVRPEVARRSGDSLQLERLLHQARRDLGLSRLCTRSTARRPARRRPPPPLRRPPAWRRWRVTSSRTVCAPPSRRAPTLRTPARVENRAGCSPSQSPRAEGPTRSGGSRPRLFPSPQPFEAFPDPPRPVPRLGRTRYARPERRSRAPATRTAPRRASTSSPCSANERFFSKNPGPPPS